MARKRDNDTIDTSGYPLVPLDETLRTNTTTSLIDEDIIGGDFVYEDRLIKHGNHAFIRANDRRAVCEYDAIAGKFTHGIADIFCADMLPIYVGDERWTGHEMAFKNLKIMDLLRELIPVLMMDGHALFHPYFDDFGAFRWWIGGDDGCPPRFWTRAGDAARNPNMILRYDVNYLPIPAVDETASTMQPINRVFTFLDVHAMRLFHFTLGGWNDGFGRAPLKRAWDTITKLRIGSNASQFKNDIRWLATVPHSWDVTKKAKFLELIQNWGKRRVLIVNQVQNPNTQESTGLPSVGMMSMMNGQTGTDARQGGALVQTRSLTDEEWSRLFAATSFGKTWWVNTEAGSVTGSEFNFTDDQLAEEVLFSKFIPTFESICWFLGMVGLMDPLPEGARIVYWKRARMLDAQRQAMQQQQSQMQQQQDVATGMEPSRGENEWNAWVHDMVINAIRENSVIPMQPVFSSTVKSIGVADQRLLVQFHGSKGGYSTYAYDLDDDARALSYHQSMAASPTKGGFVWDYLRGKKPGQSIIPPGRTVPGGGSSSIVPYEAHARSPAPLAMSSRVMKPLAQQMQAGKMATIDPRTGQPVGTRRLADPVAPQMMYPKASEPNPTTSDTTTTTTPDIPSPPSVSTTTTTSGTADTGTEAETEGFRGRPPADRGTGERGRIPKQKFWNEAMPAVDDVDVERLSYTRFNELMMNETGQGLSKTTWEKFKKVLGSERQNVKRHNHDGSLVRENELFVGKSMDFNVPLVYNNGRGGVNVEFACARDWRKLNGGTFDVQVYHLNKKHVVGRVNFGWDHKKNEPRDVYEIDIDAVNRALGMEGKKNSRLASKLMNGEPLSISTEYNCDIEVINGRRYQRNFRDMNVALVDEGNCPSPICQIEMVRPEGDAE